MAARPRLDAASACGRWPEGRLGPGQGPSDSYPVCPLLVNKINTYSCAVWLPRAYLRVGGFAGRGPTGFCGSGTRPQSENDLDCQVRFHLVMTRAVSPVGTVESPIILISYINPIVLSGHSSDVLGTQGRTNSSCFSFCGSGVLRVEDPPSGFCGSGTRTQIGSSKGNILTGWPSLDLA